MRKIDEGRMPHDIRTGREPVRFKLSKYIIPSVISMVIVGTNTNIDGLFIGSIMGDDGLAAINIVWPIVALVAAVGTGIGVGGSVVFNAMRGRGEHESAETAKNTTMLLLVTAGIAVTLALVFLYMPLLRIMGAEGNVLALAGDYAAVISLGAVAQIFGAGIVVILRNDYKTYSSMVYSFIGVGLHIIMDLTLAGPYGMRGVAAATVLSQLAVAAGGFMSVRKEKSARPDMRLAADIIKKSAAPFGINFVPSLVLMFTNYAALYVGGGTAVAAYAVMSYAVYTFDYIFQGVCDGIQPIISHCTGAGDTAQKKRAMRTAALILLAAAAIFAALTPVLIQIMPRMFNVSEDANEMMRSGFVIYALSYPFKAAVKYVCSYYYASGNTKLSNILVYLDPLCFTPVLLVIFSFCIGVNGVWAAMPVSQLVLTAIGITLFAKERKTGLRTV